MYDHVSARASDIRTALHSSHSPSIILPHVHSHQTATISGLLLHSYIPRPDDIPLP